MQDRKLEVKDRVRKQKALLQQQKVEAQVALEQKLKVLPRALHRLHKQAHKERN
jgi:hypothetical protein